MIGLPGTKADDEEAYKYTIEDFDTMLSCPVCRAKEMSDVIVKPTSRYVIGQKRTCTVVLSLGEHECEEHKGKKNAQIT